MITGRQTLSLTGLAVIAATAWIGAQQPAPAPQIPQPIFRAPEDTRKTGVKPEDIKAGVRPDYIRLREQLVVVPVQGKIASDRRRRREHRGASQR